MKPVIQPRRLDKWITAPAEAYRAGTELQCIPIAFPLYEGGLGDVLSWIPALQWIAEKHTHVHGRLIVHPFLADLAHYFFNRYEHWTVEYFPEGWKRVGPNVACLGFPPADNPSVFNSMSSRLSVPGWAYLANTAEIPEGWDVYPDLTGLEFPTGETARKLEPGQYVIFTPGATSPTRTVPGEFWNPVLEWCVAQGLTPVFLGKSHLTPELPVSFANLRYDLGIDLRDRTTTLEAAALMKFAYATVGLDNGLLHLAACTGGNVVFGYNVTTVEHRVPRMRGGRLINVFLDPEELACIGCQSRMHFSVPHDFRLCLYAKSDAQRAKDEERRTTKAPKCVEMLFSGDSRLWIAALEMLK